MKNLFIPAAVAAVLALTGCAVAPQDGYYAQPRDPSQWRVVSVTPVPAGTGDRIAASTPDGSRVEYSSRPVDLRAPVYVPAPVYVEEPAYMYPPVSLSLGFMFGRHWSSGHGRAHFRGRHR